VSTHYPPSCYLCAIAFSTVKWERYHHLPSWPLVRKGKAFLPIFYDWCLHLFFVIFFTTPPPSLNSSSPDSSLKWWRFKVLGLFVVWLHVEFQGFCKTKRGSQYGGYGNSHLVACNGLQSLLLESWFMCCSCDGTCVFHYSFWRFVIPNLISKSKI
jgi:hypothetical protein